MKTIKIIIKKGSYAEKIIKDMLKRKQEFREAVKSGTVKELLEKRKIERKINP